MNTTIAIDDVQVLYPGHDPSNINLYRVTFTDDSDHATITYAGNGQDAYYCLPEYRRSDGTHYWVTVDGSQTGSAGDVAAWVAHQGETTVREMRPTHPVTPVGERDDLMANIS